VEQAQAALPFSERRICRTIEQPQSTQRYEKQPRSDEEQLTSDIVALASK
jgi:hypothetical protein